MKWYAEEFFEIWELNRNIKVNDCWIFSFCQAWIWTANYTRSKLSCAWWCFYINRVRFCGFTVPIDYRMNRFTLIVESYIDFYNISVFGGIDIDTCRNNFIKCHFVNFKFSRNNRFIDKNECYTSFLACNRNILLNGEVIFFVRRYNVSSNRSFKHGKTVWIGKCMLLFFLTEIHISVCVRKNIALFVFKQYIDCADKLSACNCDFLCQLGCVAVTVSYADSNFALACLIENMECFALFVLYNGCAVTKVKAVAYNFGIICWACCIKHILTAHYNGWLTIEYGNGSNYARHLNEFAFGTWWVFSLVKSLNLVDYALVGNGNFIIVVGVWILSAFSHYGIVKHIWLVICTLSIYIEVRKIICITRPNKAEDIIVFFNKLYILDFGSILVNCVGCDFFISLIARWIACRNLDCNLCAAVKLIKRESNRCGTVILWVTCNFFDCLIWTEKSVCFILNFQVAEFCIIRCGNRDGVVVITYSCAVNRWEIIDNRLFGIVLDFAWYNPRLFADIARKVNSLNLVVVGSTEIYIFIICIDSLYIVFQKGKFTVSAVALVHSVISKAVVVCNCIPRNVYEWRTSLCFTRWCRNTCGLNRSCSVNNIFVAGKVFILGHIAVAVINLCPYKNRTFLIVFEVKFAVECAFCRLACCLYFGNRFPAFLVCWSLDFDWFYSVIIFCCESEVDFGFEITRIGSNFCYLWTNCIFQSCNCDFFRRSASVWTLVIADYTVNIIVFGSKTAEVYTEVCACSWNALPYSVRLFAFNNEVWNIIVRNIAPWKCCRCAVNCNTLDILDLFRTLIVAHISLFWRIGEVSDSVINFCNNIHNAVRHYCRVDVLRVRTAVMLVNKSPAFKRSFGIGWVVKRCFCNTYIIVADYRERLFAVDIVVWCRSHLDKLRRDCIINQSCRNDVISKTFLTVSVRTYDIVIISYIFLDFFIIIACCVTVSDFTQKFKICFVFCTLINSVDCCVVFYGNLPRKRDAGFHRSYGNLINRCRMSSVNINLDVFVALTAVFIGKHKAKRIFTCYNILKWPVAYIVNAVRLSICSTSCFPFFAVTAELKFALTACFWKAAFHCCGKFDFVKTANVCFIVREGNALYGSAGRSYSDCFFLWDDALFVNSNNTVNILFTALEVDVGVGLICRFIILCTVFIDYVVINSVITVRLFPWHCNAVARNSRRLEVNNIIIVMNKLDVNIAHTLSILMTVCVFVAIYGEVAVTCESCWINAI